MTTSLLSTETIPEIFGPKAFIHFPYSNEWQIVGRRLFQVIPLVQVVQLVKLHLIMDT